MRFLLYILLLLSTSPLNAQSLFLNGGFEDVNECTEYDAKCAPEAWISSSPGFANYFNDANRALTGSKCMAIEAGHSSKPFFRSFIRTELVCGLLKGQQYRLFFYIKSPHYKLLDSVGFYFGSNEPLMERRPVHKLAPSGFLTPHNRFGPDTNWQKVDILYTARGGEKFFTLAYFGVNDITGSTGVSMVNVFQVFIDEIALAPNDPAETLCAEWEGRKEEIYGMNARHQFLNRVLRAGSLPPDKPLALPLTRVVKRDTVILPDVLFETGTAILSSSYQSVLDSFCRKQSGRTIDSLIITGHTDNTGADTMNLRLSNERARAVAGYLQRCAHLGRVYVKVDGKGSSQPVAPNDTPQSRQRNRRVEMLLYFRE